MEGPTDCMDNPAMITMIKAAIATGEYEWDAHPGYRA